MNASRPRAVVLLVAVLGLQLATVGGAMAGDPSCLCDARMCVHHSGQHAAHASAPSDASVNHVHASATVTTESTSAVPEPASATHCHTVAAVSSSSAAPRECSMRGCERHGEESLPLSPLASLPHPASVEIPEGVSAVPALAALSMLDRPSAIEPPPPRSFPV